MELLLLPIQSLISLLMDNIIFVVNASLFYQILIISFMELKNNESNTGNSYLGYRKAEF